MIDPVEITAVISAVIAAVGGICVPTWIRWRERRSMSAQTQVVSWDSMNKALDRDKRELQNQLRDVASNHRIEMAELEARHRQQIKDMEEDYEARANNLRRRITELETDVQALHLSLRSLGGKP